MTRPNLYELDDFLKWDGSLRDIYVFGADRLAWVQFVEFAGRLPHRFTQSNKVADLYFDDAIFEQTEHRLLTIYPIRLDLNCHFFTFDQIEIDFDIRYLKDKSNHDLFLNFVENLSDALNKPVSITPENQSASPYVTYSHSTGDWVKY